MIVSDRDRVEEITRAARRKLNKSGFGFTLIELSIVLVIIGLIVGGVLTGRDLIKAAEVRATITQVEKFNTAVNTFYGKYGALPGDLNAQTATAFGFTPRGSLPGEGDGNGVIEGNNGTANIGYVEGAGETVMFWVDLTTANGVNVNLIDGSFSTATPGTPTSIASAQVPNYFPAAKLGGGNYFYVWNLNALTASGSPNFFGLSSVSGVSNAGGCIACLNSSPGLTVKQAYDMDKKIDDGLPTSGRVIAEFADGTGNYGSYTPWSPNAASASSATCYDTTSNNYSLTMSGGNNVNCALSFQMQAGD